MCELDKIRYFGYYWFISGCDRS